MTQLPIVVEIKEVGDRINQSLWNEFAGLFMGVVMLVFIF